MLFLRVIVCFVTCIFGIKCFEMTKIIYVIPIDNETCFVAPEYILQSNSTIKLNVTNYSGHPSHVRLQGIGPNVTVNENIEFGNNATIQETSSYYISDKTMLPNQSQNYSLVIQITYGNDDQQNGLTSTAKCTTKISFAHHSSDTPDIILQISLAIIGGASGVLILFLFGVIIYYKRRVKLLCRHRNLNMRADKIEEEKDNDDRYLTKPRQKAMKGDGLFENDQDCNIYEDPHALQVSPMPPELPTSPRPDRGIWNTLKTFSSSATIRSNESSNSTFPRPKLTGKETKKLPIGLRPPLDLPPSDPVYNEADDDETYEEPSETINTQNRSCNTLPGLKISKLDMDKNKVLIKFGQKLPKIPVNYLKPPAATKTIKPSVSQSKPLPPLKNVVQLPKSNTPDVKACKRPLVSPIRNMQTPVKQKLPDPRNVKKSVPIVKTKPPVALPQLPPIPHIQHDYDVGDGSSDEEYWAPEPRSMSPIYGNNLE